MTEETLKKIRSLETDQIVRYRCGRLGREGPEWEPWKEGPLYVAKQDREFEGSSRNYLLQKGAVLIVTPQKEPTAEYTECDYEEAGFFTSEDHCFEIDWRSCTAPSAEPPSPEPLVEITVPLFFEGEARVSLPAWIAESGPGVAEAMARNIALSRALATCNNPDGPEEDAFDEFIQEFETVDEEMAGTAWDMSECMVESGVWRDTSPVPDVPPPPPGGGGALYREEPEAGLGDIRFESGHLPRTPGGQHVGLPIPWLRATHEATGNIVVLNACRSQGEARRLAASMFEWMESEMRG